jgi:hypothetical protein
LTHNRFSNSEVRARPWKLAPPWLEDARLDATLGVKVIKERADVIACATGRISFSFADIEEKRSSEDNKDEYNPPCPPFMLSADLLWSGLVVAVGPSCL